MNVFFPCYICCYDLLFSLSSLYKSLQFIFRWVSFFFLFNKRNNHMFALCLLLTFSIISSIVCVYLFKLKIGSGRFIRPLLPHTQTHTHTQLFVFCFSFCLLYIYYPLSIYFFSCFRFRLWLVYANFVHFRQNKIV